MIRCAEEKDRPAIGRIYCEAWKAAYRGLVPDSFLDSLSDENCMPPPGKVADGSCLVYEAGGTAVGLVSFGPDRDGEDMAEIRTIYVLPEKWRCGIGAELFAAALKALKGRGHDRVFLWTLEGNARARRFYESRGMKHAGFREKEIAGKLLAECRYEIMI